MTRLRSSGILLALILLVSIGAWVIIQLSAEDIRQANDSGVGPRATEGNVSIDYPAEDPPLGVSLDEWLAGWGDPAGLEPLQLVEEEGGTEYWSTETRSGLSVAVDLAVIDDVVQVAQLAVENAAGDDDDAVLVDEVIPAFVEASGAPGLVVELGLDDPETLFEEEPREATGLDAGVTGYLAVNRFGLVLGTVGG
jgi:hypothetical protein